MIPLLRGESLVSAAAASFFLYMKEAVAVLSLHSMGGLMAGDMCCREDSIVFKALKNAALACAGPLLPLSV